jgi:hypothetical protein
MCSGLLPAELRSKHLRYNSTEPVSIFKAQMFKFGKIVKELILFSVGMWIHFTLECRLYSVVNEERL